MGYLLLGAGTLSTLGFHEGAVLKPVDGCCIGGRAEAEYCEMLSAGKKGMKAFSISASPSNFQDRGEVENWAILCFRQSECDLWMLTTMYSRKAENPGHFDPSLGHSIPRVSTKSNTLPNFAVRVFLLATSMQSRKGTLVSMRFLGVESSKQGSRLMLMHAYGSDSARYPTLGVERCTDLRISCHQPIIQHWFYLRLAMQMQS